MSTTNLLISDFVSTLDTSWNVSPT